MREFRNYRDYMRLMKGKEAPVPDESPDCDPPEEKEFLWPNPDSSEPVQFVRAVRYGHNPYGGGVSVGFIDSVAAHKVFNELITKSSPYFINRAAFNQVRPGEDGMTKDEVLGIDPEEPTLLHLESLSENNLKRLDGAIRMQCDGASLPQRLFSTMAVSYDASGRRNSLVRA